MSAAIAGLFKAARALHERQIAMPPPYRAAPTGAMCVTARAFAPRLRWIRWPFLEDAPLAALTAVEPDERFADACEELPRTQLVRARIENTRLMDGAFDIVHSCHTIEHLGEPFAALKDHNRVLCDGGLLLIDAPNIALIGGDDIVEEWFIDKHLFHFSHATLSRMIEAAGFTILQQADPADAVNLLFVAKKTHAPRDEIDADPTEAAHAMDLMVRYQQTRTYNLAALREAARELGRMQPRRIALWGAGRLFDLLVREGGFDPQSLALLIDGPLKKHMEQRHGAALSGPEALTGDIDAVVVMSRMFAGEIADDIRRRAPRAQIILYADLLARARVSKAA
jgi:SAM-dependent methyltransferase